MDQKTDLVNDTSSVDTNSLQDLKKPENNGLTLITLLETAKFYTSLCLGTTAFVSVFAFLFLIPFVVDPAITTILADYESEAVTCIAIDHVYAEGLRNCSWSSCREGCTNAATRCHQILVNYSQIPFREWKLRSSNKSMQITWEMSEIRLLVNAEGCGYPPYVNCSEFAKQYGYNTLSTPFPCYYSRSYPENVVTRYSWDNNLRQLVLSILIPNFLFAVSVGVLIYWYCPRYSFKCAKMHLNQFPVKVDDADFDNEVY